jgi:hypothetical protein
MMLRIIVAALLALSGEVMAASVEPLKQFEVGSYAEIGARPNPQHFAIQAIPSLAAILLSVEQRCRAD